MRVTLASHDGAYDRHAGRPGELGDGAVNLDVHLVQRLLHPLHAANPLLDQVGQLPVNGSEAADCLTGTERGTQQTTAVQKLDPLAVMEVGLSAQARCAAVE